MITPLSWRAFTLQDKNPPDGGSYLRRKMLTPAFHFKILESFLDVMNAQCSVLCNEVLAPLANTGEFDVFPIVREWWWWWRVWCVSNCDSISFPFGEQKLWLAWMVAKMTSYLDRIYNGLFGVLRKNGHFVMFGFIQVTHCALDMICETAMGRSINANDEIKWLNAIFINIDTGYYNVWYW